MSLAGIALFMLVLPNHLPILIATLLYHSGFDAGTALRWLLGGIPIGSVASLL
jgi:hypothetical protein